MHVVLVLHYFLNYGTKIIQLHLFLGNLADRAKNWITSHRQVLSLLKIIFEVFRDSFYIFGWSGGGKKSAQRMIFLQLLLSFWPIA